MLRHTTARICETEEKFHILFLSSDRWVLVSVKIIKYTWDPYWEYKNLLNYHIGVFLLNVYKRS